MEIIEVVPPNRVKWEDTHAIVHVALNEHVYRNRDPADNTILGLSAAGFVAVGGWSASGA